MPGLTQQVVAAGIRPWASRRSEGVTRSYVGAGIDKVIGCRYDADFSLQSVYIRLVRIPYSTRLLEPPVPGTTTAPLFRACLTSHPAGLVRKQTSSVSFVVRGLFMFGLFGRKPTGKGRPQAQKGMPLYFKDSESAFDASCKYMDCTLKEGALLPAIVLDANKLFGVRDAVSVKADGKQVAFLKVASNDGGFVVVASTPSDRGPQLEAGQLVSWLAGQHAPEILSQLGQLEDKRSGWIGIIVGVLNLEWDQINGWSGAAQFKL